MKFGKSQKCDWFGFCHIQIAGRRSNFGNEGVGIWRNVSTGFSWIMTRSHYLRLALFRRSCKTLGLLLQSKQYPIGILLDLLESFVSITSLFGRTASLTYPTKCFCKTFCTVCGWRTVLLLPTCGGLLLSLSVYSYWENHCLGEQNADFCGFKIFRFSIVFWFLLILWFS